MSARILVVDDEEHVRGLIVTLLKKGGYETAERDSAAALKEAMADPQPDVVLLDLKLPDAEGLDLLPPLKKAWPETEVIVLTGFATIDAAVAATKLGAYSFQQ